MLCLAQAENSNLIDA